jgi:hypothetical protein
MALFLANLVTQGIYAGMINAISTVTMRSVYLADAIYSYKHPDVTAQIKRLDIERRLRTVESVIKVLGARSQRLDSEQELAVSRLIESNNSFEDPIEICLIYVEESIKTVHRDLLRIKEKIESHQKLWFSSWRTLDVENLIASLKMNSDILDARFNDLTKIALFLRGIDNQGKHQSYRGRK